MLSPIRTICLVRHGAYDAADPAEHAAGKALLDIGVMQAEHVAGRLVGSGLDIERVVSSDYTRARQTAELIAGRLPGVPLQVDPDLREVFTFYYGEGNADAPPPSPGLECASHPPGAQAAFHRYFIPPGDRSRAEVLVCHGNLIRYFLCRLVALTRRQWNGLFVATCSVTEVQIDGHGDVELVTICSEDHLPPELRL
jgi:serine/threonine-protein phosphatase PGAM5